MKNVQLIQFMNLNRCQFANLPYCLRRIPRKLPTLTTATMMTIDDDNEPKDISRQTSYYNGAMDAISEII
jgi:hypothetical protein